MSGRFDVILVQPYPFADHPSFPEALLKRVLEEAGYTVGVIAVPRWQQADDFRVLGEPRLFFAVVSGPVDSVVLNYTSTRKRRREDQYQFNGDAYFPGSPPSVSSRIRPDRTVIVYCNRIREAFPDTPIVIGGIEASLRRFSHYDFQQDRIRRSILFDSRADLLVAGMGENPILEIARRRKTGEEFDALRIPGTAIIRKTPYPDREVLNLPSHEEILADPARLLAGQIRIESAQKLGQAVWQVHGDRGVWEFPAAAIAPRDLDRIYDLPFTRIHPGTEALTPALQMNLFSVTSHRGCGGGCRFCSIMGHQGKRVVSRSPDSILGEIERMTRHPRWAGVIFDIGGASADLYGSDCASGCVRDSCLFPAPCPRFRSGQPYLDLLRQARKITGVKRVLVGSGLRYDTVMRDPDLLVEIMSLHAGRFLRVAPEHTEEPILQLMGKPSHERFVEFVKLFREINRTLKRKIELALYLIVGHPGETDREVMEMKKKLRELKVDRIDVQIFTPTPGTLSTAMYVGGIDLNGEPIPVERRIPVLEKRLRQFTDFSFRQL